LVAALLFGRFGSHLESPGAIAYGSAARLRSVSARFGFSRRLRISGRPSGRDSSPPHTHTHSLQGAQHPHR
jgi:hypothetical protein